MFEVFSPIWSHVNENKKKIVKNQKCKILKNKHKLSICGINLLDKSEKNGFYERTDDGPRVKAIAMLCSSTNQS